MVMLTVCGSEGLPSSQINDHVPHGRLIEAVITGILGVDADHMLDYSLQRLAAAQQVRCNLRAEQLAMNLWPGSSINRVSLCKLPFW